MMVGSDAAVERGVAGAVAGGMAGCERGAVEAGGRAAEGCDSRCRRARMSATASLPSDGSISDVLDVIALPADRRRVFDPNASTDTDQSIQNRR
jgi:hypothetical protein